MLDLEFVHRVDDHIGVWDRALHERYSTMIDHITAEQNAGSKFLQLSRRPVVYTFGPSSK
jgi:hypothetical protein